MTDKELRDAAVVELKKTTQGYLKSNGQPRDTIGTQWKKGLDLLAQIGVVVPPPPGGTATKRGAGYLRYGDGELPASHTADYDFVVISWGGAPAAGASTAKKVLVYMSAISCKTGASGAYHFGVTSEEARANGWVMLDSVGAEMTNFEYGAGAVPLGDPGLTGYQQRWAQNVDALLTRWGCDGVFIDDTLFWTTGIANGQIPQKYPTQPQWMEAVRQFNQAVGAYLRSRGRYVVANAGGWFPGSADYAGDNDLALWTVLAPHVDGLCSETWLFHPAMANNQVRKVGLGWDQNWDGWMRLPALCEAQGIDHHAISYSTLSSSADYAICSMLLENQGTIYFIPGDSSSYDRNLIWHSFYDRLPLGLSSGAKVANGNRWERQFANGRIWVDPVLGTAGII